MNARFRLLTAGLVALPLVLGSLAAKAQDFKVGVVGNVGALAVFVAVEKGFFAKNGIDVKVEIRNTGAEMSKGIRAGEFDFAPAGYTNLPVALERGMDVRGVVGYVGGVWAKATDDNMMALIAHPNSGIASVKDLKGKKIGATFGAASDAYLQELLKINGMSVNDVERVNVSPPSMTSVLETGGVDAVVAWEPFATRTLDKVADAKLIQRGGDLICFCGQLHGSPAAIYKDEAVTQKFVDAMSEAHAYTRNPKNADEVAEIGARFANMTKDEVLRTKGFWTYDPRFGNANTDKAFNDSVQLLIDQKKMKAPYDPAKYLEPKFIKSTMERHPEWFADLKG
jgi:ABC-type nitrate/sulfonate/bicarbonate transport system substrate-binding protein